MMRKFVAVVGIMAVLGAIVFALMNNKAKMDAKLKANQIPTVNAVSVAAVIKQKLDENLSQVGLIAANRDIAVAAETQGKVTAVYVQVGAMVRAGAPLVQVDNELQRAGYLTAQSNYDKAKKDLERYTALHKDELITDSQFESARLAMEAAQAQYISARRQFNNATVTSPISGLVTARPVDVGTMLAPGMPVANVVDIASLKVKLNIAEGDVFHLKVGDPVTVTTDVYPGAKYPGRIATISAKGDEAHTYPVEIVISNSKDNPLKAGMFGKVAFNLNTTAEALVIPREALVGSIKEPQVFVVSRGVAKLRDILVGAAVDAQLAVLQGLAEGERVVVSGQDNLSDNAPVTIVK